MNTREDIDSISLVDESPPLTEMVLANPNVNYLLHAEINGKYELWERKGHRKVCWRREKHTGQWVQIYGWCGRQPLPSPDEMREGERMLKQYLLEIEYEERQRREDKWRWEESIIQEEREKYRARELSDNV